MVDTSVKTGEKLNLYLGKGPYYRTNVDELEPDGSVLVKLPVYRGMPVVLTRGQEIRIYFYRENGRFMQDARVKDVFQSDEQRTVRLKLLSDPVKQQRRESFRVSSVIHAVLRPQRMGAFPEVVTPEESAEMEEVPTFNISATGIAVRTSKPYLPGDRIYMKIFLTWPNEDPEPLELMGEVRQVYRVDSQRDMYQLGIMFLELSAELSTQISKFVLIEEQRRTQTRKLVEDD